jgi:hypothetical protein
MDDRPAGKADDERENDCDHTLLAARERLRETLGVADHHHLSRRV